MHLVGLITRMYHDTWSYECQTDPHVSLRINVSVNVKLSEANTG